jgi:signal transduction histidine kinase
VRLVVTYLGFGLLWIYCSDQVVAAIFRTPKAIIHASTFKGYAFILASAALLYVLTQREERARHAAKHQLEASLVNEQEARREAEAANTSKDSFIAVVSHEMRTPLTSMVGWVDLLENKQLSEEAHGQAVRSLARNTNSLVTLVNDLLDSSRIALDKLEIIVEEFDFSEMLRDAIDDSRSLLTEKHQQLAMSDLPPRLAMQGDRERLRQVVVNLLNNATKFTPTDGHIIVTVTPTVTHLTLTVADTGIGIEPELIPRVFEPYWQGQSSGARRFNGLGLGLPIVRHIVTLHGGSIEVKSPGRDLGSTFTVSLPLDARAS